MRTGTGDFENVILSARITVLIIFSDKFINNGFNIYTYIHTYLHLNSNRLKFEANTSIVYLIQQYFGHKWKKIGSDESLTLREVLIGIVHLCS